MWEDLADLQWAGGSLANNNNNKDGNMKRDAIIDFRYKIPPIRSAAASNRQTKIKSLSEVDVPVNISNSSSSIKKKKKKTPMNAATVKKKPRMDDSWDDIDGTGDSDVAMESAAGKTALTCVGCLVEPEWETLDPTPDIHVLFRHFDDRFFDSRLGGIEVRWSPRMTLCAGVCSYQRKAGFCSVRLSVPLLKLRPRKDLIETLLHEMIHAFLFVTQNNRDREGHGPEFQKHMRRINVDSGTNITESDLFPVYRGQIYHSFHDEVRLYQQHWWRCSGVCRNKAPFHGWVKRSMNRKPGPYDMWWAEHQRKCGGAFIKVREPEKKKVTTSKSTGKGKSSGIAKTIVPSKSGSPNHNASDPINSMQSSQPTSFNNKGTPDIRRFFTTFPSTSTASNVNKLTSSSLPINGKSSSNNDGNSGGRPVASVVPFEGVGRTLYSLSTPLVTSQVSAAKPLIVVNDDDDDEIPSNKNNVTASTAIDTFSGTGHTLGGGFSDNHGVSRSRLLDLHNSSVPRSGCKKGQPPSRLLDFNNRGVSSNPGLLRSRLLDHNNSVTISNKNNQGPHQNFLDLNNCSVPSKSGNHEQPQLIPTPPLSATSMVTCPVCANPSILMNSINDHLNACLS